MSKDIDVNLVSIWGSELNGTVHNFGALDGTNFDDTLHLGGHVKDVIVNARSVVGGSEDVADLNCASHNNLMLGKCTPRGQYAFTIKGDSSGNYIIATLTQHAKTVDVDIGNHSDQSSKETGVQLLDIEMQDGSKVRVRLLNGKKPSFENGKEHYRYVFPWPIPVFHPIAIWFFVNVMKLIKRFG